MFHQRMRELRNERNLRLKDLAEVLGVTTSSVGMYENNKRYPDIMAIVKLAEFFDVSVDYLLGHTDIRESVDQQIEEYVETPDVAELLELIKQIPEDKIHLVKEFLHCMASQNMSQNE